jgi:hypothetical protein
MPFELACKLLGSSGFSSVLGLTKALAVEANGPRMSRSPATVTPRPRRSAGSSPPVSDLDHQGVDEDHRVDAVQDRAAHSAISSSTLSVIRETPVYALRTVITSRAALGYVS